jgi:hypothetical protein
MRERVDGGFTYRVLYYLLLVCLCCIFAGGRCATTKGAGQERAETIAAKTQTVKEIIKGSNLSDPEKAIAYEVLDSIAQDTKQLGKDVDHNKEIADSNAEAASHWRWFLWIAGFAVVGAVGFGVKKLLL